MIKFAAGVLCVGLLVSAGILGICRVRDSIAYFTDEDAVANTFTTGDLVVKSDEPDWDDEEEGEKMEPGYSAVKNPTITNTTEGRDTPAYLRVIVTLRDRDTKETITDSRRLGLIEQMIRYCGNDEIVEGEGYSLAELAGIAAYNQEEFVLDEIRTQKGSGVYCFNRTEPLGSGASTVLFNRIVVPLEWSKKQLDVAGDFTVDIQAEAIQASGFSSLEEAMDALDAQQAAADTSSGTDSDGGET